MLSTGARCILIGVLTAVQLQHGCLAARKNTSDQGWTGWHAVEAKVGGSRGFGPKPAEHLLGESSRDFMATEVSQILLAEIVAFSVERRRKGAQSQRRLGLCVAVETDGRSVPRARRWGVRGGIGPTPGFVVLY